jgi:hypothetical protein
VDKKSHTSHKDFQAFIRLPRTIVVTSNHQDRLGALNRVTRTRITHLTKTSLIKLCDAHLSLQSLLTSNNKMTRYLNGCPWGACIATNPIEGCWYPLQKDRKIYQKTTLSDRPANTIRPSVPCNHTKLFNVLVALAFIRCLLTPSNGPSNLLKHQHCATNLPDLTQFKSTRHQHDTKHTINQTKPGKTDVTTFLDRMMTMGHTYHYSSFIMKNIIHSQV